MEWKGEKGKIYLHLQLLAVRVGLIYGYFDSLTVNNALVFFYTGVTMMEVLRNVVCDKDPKR